MEISIVDVFVDDLFVLVEDVQVVWGSEIDICELIVCCGQVFDVVEFVEWLLLAQVIELQQCKFLVNNFFCVNESQNQVEDICEFIGWELLDYMILGGIVVLLEIFRILNNKIDCKVLLEIEV